MTDASSLLPAPSSAAFFDGTFRLNAQTALLHDVALQSVGDWFRETVGKPLGISFLATRSEAANTVSLQLTDDLPIAGDEAYTLRIQPQEVQIRARRTSGLIWAIQTLRQLLPIEAFASSPTPGTDRTMPCCTIDDAPAFAWRGMMLDCARHFMPIEFIYKWIDLLSMHKFNVFHWHLTDDQGWRIEIKKYPRLTEIGAWRKQTLVGHALPKRDYDTFDGTPHGGFYTQRQIREVVAYAAARGVTIVPEIEMPGHAQAAIAAYPQLGCLEHSLDVWTVWGINPNIVNVEDATVQFFKDVLDEVIELFPWPYIHIGGDEVPKDQWRQNVGVQRRIRELGVKDEDELQSWFIRQIDAHLTARGRRMIGWDEILEGGLAGGATVMSWRGEDGGIAAARAGHDVIMTPWQKVYFDHYPTADRMREPLAIGGCTTLKDVYEYRPVPLALETSARPHVLGAQANLWTEYVLNPTHAEYMAFPRACALAEVVWSNPPHDFADFESRLAVHLQRLAAMKVNFHPSRVTPP